MYLLFKYHNTIDTMTFGPLLASFFQVENWALIFCIIQATVTSSGRQVSMTTQFSQNDLELHSEKEKVDL